jgi:hypothetical protein
VLVDIDVPVLVLVVIEVPVVVAVLVLVTDVPVLVAPPTPGSPPLPPPPSPAEPPADPSEKMPSNSALQATAVEARNVSVTRQARMFRAYQARFRDATVARLRTGPNSIERPSAR